MRPLTELGSGGRGHGPLPNISDHGLIGDLQTAALVTTDGTVDWFCCPRFDSPSVFASLLDADKGGYFRIAPDRDDYVSKQLYLPDTAILITRFMTPDGVGEVHDFMPVIEGTATDRHRLVRSIRVVRGTMRFEIDIQPRFDYGRAAQAGADRGRRACSAPATCSSPCTRVAPVGTAASDVGGHAWSGDGDGLRVDPDAARGRDRRRGAGVDGRPAAPGHRPRRCSGCSDETARFWRDWLQPVDLHRPVAGDGRPGRR